MMTTAEIAKALKTFVAAKIAPAEEIANRRTAEERCFELMKLANSQGWPCDLSITSAIFFWGNQGYFDHGFAQALWGSVVDPETGLAKWEERLAELSQIDGMYERLSYIEESLKI
jgi:hypothetical protein